MRRRSKRDEEGYDEIATGIILRLKKIGKQWERDQEASHEFQAIKSYRDGCDLQYNLTLFKLVKSLKSTGFGGSNSDTENMGRMSVALHLEFDLPDRETEQLIELRHRKIERHKAQVAFTNACKGIADVGAEVNRCEYSVGHSINGDVIIARGDGDGLLPEQIEKIILEYVVKLKLDRPYNFVLPDGVAMAKKATKKPSK
jgi:hypothetical protein